MVYAICSCGVNIILAIAYSTQLFSTKRGDADVSHNESQRLFYHNIKFVEPLSKFNKVYPQANIIY